MSIDEAQLARYGEIVARLARPLADRAAVLWLVRLDAQGFDVLEAAALAAIADDAAAAATFARAYATTHALLAVDADREMAARAAPGPPPTRVEGAPPAQAVEELDAPTLARQPKQDLDLFTLASVTHAVMPRPPDPGGRGDDG